MTFALAFGLQNAIPDTVDTAWGARLIFPDDLVPDRQDMRGPDTARLVAWMNDGPLRWSRNVARAASEKGLLRRDSDISVVLYRDARGVVVASPRASHGYLYVAAWLHDADPTKAAPADFTIVALPPEPADTGAHGMDAFDPAKLGAYQRGTLCPYCGADSSWIACSDAPGDRDRDSNFQCERCDEQWDADHVETVAAEVADWGDPEGPW